MYVYSRYRDLISARKNAAGEAEVTSWVFEVTDLGKGYNLLALAVIMSEILYS